MIPLGVLASSYVAPAGSSFAPLDLAGLVMWFDASDTGTITQDAGLVSAWADKSGNARNATSSGTQRPTTGAETLNNLNVLSFYGAQQMNAQVSQAISGTTTVYAVTKSTNYGYGRTFATITSTWQMMAPNIIFAGTQYTPGSYTAWGTVGAQFSGDANSWLRLNGSYVVGPTNVGTATGIGASGVHIGARGGQFYTTGPIAEVIVVCGDPLSAGDVASLETYLMAKWGLQ